MSFFGGCCCACVFGRKTIIAWKAWNGFDSLKNSYGTGQPVNVCVPVAPDVNPGMSSECNNRWLKRTDRIIWDGTLDGPGSGPTDDVYVYRWPRLSPFDFYALESESHLPGNSGDALDQACTHGNIDTIIRWDVLDLTATHYKVEIEFTTTAAGHFTGTREITLEEEYTTDDVRGDLEPVLASVSPDDYPFLVGGATTSFEIFATYDLDGNIIQWPTRGCVPPTGPPGDCKPEAADCDPFVVSLGAPTDIRNELGDRQNLFDAAWIYRNDVNRVGSQGCFSLIKSYVLFSGPFSESFVTRGSPNGAALPTCHGNWSANSTDTYAVQQDCIVKIIEPPALVEGFKIKRLRVFSGLKEYWKFSINEFNFQGLVGGTEFNHGPETVLDTGGKLNDCAKLSSAFMGSVAHLTTDPTAALKFDLKNWNLLFWLKVSDMTDPNLDTFKVRVTWGAEFIELKFNAGNRILNLTGNTATDAFPLTAGQWYFVRMFYKQSTQQAGMQIDGGAEAFTVVHALPAAATGVLQLTMESGQIAFPSNTVARVDEAAVFRGDFNSDAYDFLRNGGVGRTIRFDGVLFPSWV